MKYYVGFLGLISTLCLSACSFASPLDNALKNYNLWKTITVTKQVQGNMANMRSDREYQTLLEAFEKDPSSYYAILVSWVQHHQKEVPAPLYWDLASMALKEKKTDSEVLKWFFIGQGTSRYDLTRCTDKSTFGAFVELLYGHQELVQLSKKDSAQTLNAWQNSLDWLKGHPYNASPMWACSHGLSAFKSDQAKPITYSDLVTPNDQLKVNWNDYLKSVDTVLADYKSGKKKMK